MINWRQKVILGIASLGPKKLSEEQFIQVLYRAKTSTVLKENKDFFDFVMVNEQPISFQALRDIKSLKIKELFETDGVSLTEAGRAEAESSLKALTLPELKAVKSLFKAGAHKIESTADQLHSKARRQKKKQAQKRAHIFTVGYESESIDHFLSRLIEAGIRHVIDVRNTPLSRKYGFSKNELKRLLETVGIQYTHFADLGVPSVIRKQRKNLSDTEGLFRYYKTKVLPKTEGSQERALSLIKDAPAALLCYERNHHECHRDPLARRLSLTSGLEVIHLNHTSD